MQASGVLSSMEVRERASLLRKVRVRARHGENASDAEDPRRTAKGRRQTTANPRTQTRQCLIPFPLPLAEPLLGTDVISCFAIVWIKVTLECLSKRLLQSFYTFLAISSVMDPCFCLEGIKFIVNIS